VDDPPERKGAIGWGRVRRRRRRGSRRWLSLWRWEFVLENAPVFVKIGAGLARSPPLDLVEPVSRFSMPNSAGRPKPNGAICSHNWPTSSSNSGDSNPPPSVYSPLRGAARLK